MATNGNGNGNGHRQRKRERRERPFEARDAVEIRPALGRRDAPLHGVPMSSACAARCTSSTRWRASVPSASGLCCTGSRTCRRSAR